MSASSKELCVLSTVYPSCIQYLDNFFDCLRGQSVTNFTLLLMTDQINVSMLPDETPFEFMHFSADGTPANIRKLGLLKARELGFKKLVFADFDDFHYPERIEKCSKELERCEIFVHDLDVVTEEGISQGPCFARRYSKDQLIDFNAIKHGNIFGLSNTAIQTRILDNVQYYSAVIAFDWFLFSQLLYSGFAAKYSPLSLAGYRQHAKNLLGSPLNNVLPNDADKKIKMVHFNYMYKVTGDRFFLKEKNRIKMNVDKNKESFPVWLENV